jgi:hypothetical protein
VPNATFLSSDGSRKVRRIAKSPIDAGPQGRES